MTPPEPRRRRSVPQTVRTMLVEDRRLLIGAAAFALGAIVMYALVRQFGVPG